MGLTRSSSGLLIRDDFGSDTSGNYYVSDGMALAVTGGYLYSNGACVVLDIDKTGHCVTISGYRPANVTGPKVYLHTTTNPTITTATNYATFFRNSTAYWALYKGTTLLDSDTTDVPTAGTAGDMHMRLFAAANDVRAWCGRSWPLTGLLTSTDNTYGGGTVYDGGQLETSTSKWYYFEARTDHKITCTDLPADYQLQANASATYKIAAVGGTATLDVGMLEWPLTSVEVLDAANAQVFQVDTGDYADMGGGDVFAYAADATGKPYYAFAQQ